MLLYNSILRNVCFYLPLWVLAQSYQACHNFRWICSITHTVSESLWTALAIRSCSKAVYSGIWMDWRHLRHLRNITTYMLYFPLSENFIQLYFLQESRDLLLDAIHLSKDQSFCLGVKLVRGAYMDKERKLADKEGRTDPIHQSWECTNDWWTVCNVRYVPQLTCVMIFLLICCQLLPTATMALWRSCWTSSHRTQTATRSSWRRTMRNLYGRQWRGTVLFRIF